jgi:radical SAM superfamily enzyme YgiQ (UPF0313 family)
VYPKFHPRPLEHSLAELSSLKRVGAEHVAFYDDALLYRPQEILGPFLREVLRRNIEVRFHTPNAMNARFIDKETAHLLIAAGFRNIYLGFESSAYAWQKKTGGKVLFRGTRARGRKSDLRGRQSVGTPCISHSRPPKR